MSLNWSTVKALSIPVGGVARDVKRVSVGGTVLWEKPNPLPYDAEVGWLSSNGKPYIDTGVSPVASTFGVDIVFSPEGTSCPQRPFGCRSSSTTAGRGSYNVLFATEWQCRIDMMGTSTWSVAMASGSINRLTATPSGVTVNNEYKGNVSAGKTDCKYPFYLFAINNAGSAWESNRGTMTIYSCKIYANNVLVRDFIPVRVGSGADAVGCLYDRANPTGGPSGNGLYPNSGTGAFVIGPDVA